MIGLPFVGVQAVHERREPFGERRWQNLVEGSSQPSRESQRELLAPAILRLIGPLEASSSDKNLPLVVTSLCRQCDGGGLVQARYHLFFSVE